MHLKFHLNNCSIHTQRELFLNFKNIWADWAHRPKSCEVFQGIFGSTYCLFKCCHCVSLKVRKFQNEYMKSSHCPKYERKNLKNSAPFQIFSFIFWAMRRLHTFILKFPDHQSMILHYSAFFLQKGKMFLHFKGIFGIGIWIWI